METRGTLESLHPGSRGIFNEFLSLVGSVGRYIQAITALAGEESREAAEHGIRILVLLVAAFFFAALGYIFLILVVVFAAAWIFGVPWIAILSGLTALHVLLAFLSAKYVRDHLRTPIFVTTRSEIQRDLEALRRSSKP